MLAASWQQAGVRQQVPAARGWIQQRQLAAAASRRDRRPRHCAQAPRLDAGTSARHQLKRVATRVSLGIGRQGGFGGNSSGDIFIALSTADPRAWFGDQPVNDVKMRPNDRISPLFQATAQATEAAITNALLAAETTTGANDVRIYALPVDRLLAVMRKYGR